MANAVVNPIEKFVQGLLKLLGQRLREKAHTQIVIVVRDGKIQLVHENRTYLPDNLPES